MVLVIIISAETSSATRMLDLRLYTTRCALTPLILFPEENSSDSRWSRERPTSTFGTFLLLLP